MKRMTLKLGQERVVAAALSRAVKAGDLGEVESAMASALVRRMKGRERARNLENPAP